MFKKNLLFFLICCSSFAFAFAYASQEVDLYKAPIESLKNFNIQSKSNQALQSKSSAQENNNSLQEVSQTIEEQKNITRFQQFYKGVPVVGAQIMIIKPLVQGQQEQMVVNGHLLKEIELNTSPSIKAKEALEQAKKAYFTEAQAKISEEKTQLQIRVTEKDQLQLVYLISFKSVQEHKPVWPFFVIDAHSGEILQQWNNVKTYSDQGVGGNEKVHQYWYGKEGLPALDVTQNGNLCVMDNSSVKLVHLGSVWDWENLNMKAHQYSCNNNVAENVNGGFSPSNDAYYFGHTIVDMYKDWYGLNALQNADGSPMKLVMRVHFGEHYDNAFWDGQAMSFGDGEFFYPLVSLDVAGHEVTHGFTEHHSGLEYHDQSGALNESASDMAGQASRAYLLEKNPLLYSKAYLDPNAVTWGIGETIVKDSFGKALRFMDRPSEDGVSAECLDKDLAQSNGADCPISYKELVDYADNYFPSPQAKQSFIVHTASGIFNKAFYLLSQKVGIKTAYHVMIVANTKYWTPSTDFTTGACGVIHASQDLQVDLNTVKNVFGQVGIDTEHCS